MITATRTAIFSAALLAVVGTPASVSAQSEIRERIADAVQGIQEACGDDINQFCGNVTRGEGRVLLCMQSHDDQLSRGCQWTLYRVSRGLERTLNSVEQIADACPSDIESQCDDADGIGQSVMDKVESFSPACQSVVGARRQLGDTMETRGSR